jgi:hypothetical protein
LALSALDATVLMPLDRLLLVGDERLLDRALLVVAIDGGVVVVGRANLARLLLDEEGAKRSGDDLLVEVLLGRRERRVEQILLLGWQVLLDVNLETPQEERLEDRVELGDDAARAFVRDELLAWSTRV